ncbi:hypothetical protein SAMN05444273_104389 [Litoreibacter ascidiaceicola]|uniref:Uncharacterized protein n=1 Tax=Litoreibacter ascidiaceicola TaxID=1486859 RepID=A0A1M4ZZM2_9RHOB|nr:hypothetical protein SAMN05444273_104389 [Litoreibacter ascidiaceicola]
MRGGPVSRILSKGLPPLDDHSSKATVTRDPLAANPNLLGTKHPRRQASTRFLFGIAPGGACRATPVASGAVGSYPTVSPLPPHARAVSSLWRFPSDRSARALPGTVALWSPDFPRTRRPAVIRPSAQCLAYAPAAVRSIPNSRTSASAIATSCVVTGPSAVGLNRSRKLANTVSGATSSG